MNSNNSTDISREGFTLNKGTHLLRVLFSKRAIEVLGAYSEFTEIDPESLMKQGKTCIILDVDECIAPHHGRIIPKNLEKIKSFISRGFMIVVFSNMKKTNRYEELERLGIRVITSKYAKPDPRGFMECIKSFGLVEKEQVVMIGDNYLTDGGCKIAGIDFIKIKPIETEENTRSINRKIQLVFRDLVDIIAQKIHKTLKYK